MRLNQKCPVCEKLHGNTDKYCSIKCAFDDSNAVNCTQGMDVMMYCTDSKCPYHNAVKEKELEKPTLEKQLTAAQAEIARLKELLNEARNVIRMKNEKIEDLSSQVKSILARANGVANKNIQLQSALDVAVEGIKKRT